jgi:hypothetical protein
MLTATILRNLGSSRPRLHDLTVAATLRTEVD